MKERVKFETSKISSDIDPSGSYKLHITERPIYDETRVFGEVVTEKHLPFDEDLLQFAFLAVLTTVSKKVSKDCNPRKIGNYLKFLPTIRGKVKGPYSAYNPATCSTAIVIQSLSGLEKSVDMDYIQFVNARQGVKGVVKKLAWLGSSVDGQAKRGEKFLATGDNLTWLDGDRIEFSWARSDGSIATGTITTVASDSDVNHIVFDWPSALDGVADGTEVTFTFYLRGGIEEAEPNPSHKTVTVLAGDTPGPSGPVFTKVTAPGHEDDPEWANKVSRDGQIVILGTGFTDAVTAEFSTDGTPETFNVTARTSTSITGQIAGGLEAGGTLVMELKDDDNVIDTASIDVVE